MRPHTGLLLFVCLMTLACQSKVAVKEPPPSAEEVRWVFHVKDHDERMEKEQQKLIRMGETAFPAYEEILADPKSESIEVIGVFRVLFYMNVERRRFIKYALSRLLDKDNAVRQTAVILLGRIGSPTEASPVVALLSEEHKNVGYYAAKTLAAIGGPNEVVAMDVWLRGVSHRDDRQLREHVQKCRDELKKRLAEIKAPTK